MIISTINRSTRLNDEDILPVIRAINRQIQEDFYPYWSLNASLRLEGKIGKKINKNSLADMRGDAVLYLADEADIKDALGYHEANFRGIPYGFVFMDVCDSLGETWTVTLSHEALELIGDMQGNLLVQGPHPEDPQKEVFHWFEMCDAVQSQTYQIDGVEVSNFVLPAYFTLSEEEGSRNDFLAKKTKGKGLASFGISAGSYIGFYNPESGKHETCWGADDAEAKERSALKAKAKSGRGFIRSHVKGNAVKELGHKRVTT
ncbi:MAG: hypothetical protein HY253_07210 [Burkholderiales bacterium]|nr:hypothetical protein [Burkholderiales bacterium]